MHANARVQVINIQNICIEETPRTKTAHIQLDAQPTVVQQSMFGVNFIFVLSSSEYIQLCNTVVLFVRKVDQEFSETQTAIESSRLT